MDAAAPTWIRSHCPFCAYQCGMLIGEPQGAPVAIQGDPRFPVNEGELCIKGWSAGALLRHPRRLVAPQVRGGDGRWREASWEAALDLVGERLAAIRDESGPEALGVFGSGALTNEKAYLLGKFARLALRTPHIDYNGRYCMASAAAAANRAFGLDRGLPFPVADLEQSEVICLVGSNAVDTLPPLARRLERQKAAGGRLIVLDPRMTATARLADLFLQPTPGTDLVLANGLLFLAIEERLLDEAAIARRTTGFDAARRVALCYDPARVERLTGVPQARLRQAVRWLAGARSAAILTGRGAEQHAQGTDTVHAWINLALALGLVGRPSSGYGCLTGQGNGQGGREHGQKADQLPGYRLIEDEAHREAVAKLWGVDPASLPRKGRSAFELLDSLGPGGIRGLLVMGSNLAVASPDLNRVENRLRSLDFLAVADALPNETTEYAHVILPVLQWAEEEGTLTNLEGRVIRRRAAVRPPAGVRSDLEILRGLAERLGCGPQFALESPRAVFDELRRATAGAAADYSGITYERIDREGGVFWPCPAEDHPGTARVFTGRFAHPDGRARFVAVEHRPAGEAADAAFPLLFTTGRDREHYNSGAQTRSLDRLREARPRPRLQIHPRLAARHAIGPGATVVLESRRGRAEFQAEITAEIRPDTVFAPFHWGGREAANRLTAPVLDPISRMPQFKLAAVRIAAVVPGPSPQDAPGAGRPAAIEPPPPGPDGPPPAWPTTPSGAET